MCKHFLQLETYNNWNSVFDNLAKFLAKSNLVADGLTKFTDRAENYWAWRAFFCNAIEGLSLKPREKLDVLTQWLGEELSKNAKRIHPIHLNNSAEGQRQVWTRLQNVIAFQRQFRSHSLRDLNVFLGCQIRPQNLRELCDLMQPNLMALYLD